MTLKLQNKYKINSEHTSIVPVITCQVMLGLVGCQQQVIMVCNREESLNITSSELSAVLRFALL